MINKLLSPICLCFLLLGCNSETVSGSNTSNDNSPPLPNPEDFISIDKFKTILKEESGFNSNDCDETQIEENTALVNACVKNSFENNKQFYSVYHIQGIDSKKAKAITMNASGIVKYWDYDGGMADGRISESYVGYNECDNPEIKLDLNKYEMKVFNCSNSN